MDICLLLLLLIWSFSRCLQVGAGPMRCGRTSKPCRDGSECVFLTHVCDGEPDCEDGSDEEDCETKCTEEQFQCSHGKKCIGNDQVCDGVPDCQDRSDELNCVKRTEGCVHYCDDNSRCLPEIFLCDGEKDCSDGTDEDKCEKEEETRPTTPPPVLTLTTPVKCPRNSKHCKDKLECVFYIHVCDGEADCKDGSDEEECSTACESGQFQCAHGMKCIEQSQLCDGVLHCQDHSDELDCAVQMEDCAHQCDGKSRCLPKSFLCDGEGDCLDGSDEANCEFKVCSANQFKCTTGQCVSAAMRCDGHTDCVDHSDEKNCIEAPVCDMMLSCPQSKECLLQEWMCDGEPDCRDGTDEKNCSVSLLNCGDYQWMCNSKSQCVSSSWRCDGMKDCEDGSDEMKCGVVSCLPHQFMCGSQECLEPALVCNGITNCADGSDEEGKCQRSCTEVDLSCSQSCYSTPQGPRCGCAPGFRLLENGKTCVDIDECEGYNRVCSQLCTNSAGSYQCDCHPGFVMEADGHHCKITDVPFLLVSVQTDLFVLGIRSSSLDIISTSARNAVLTVDYDFTEQKLFWACLETSVIGWSSMDNKTQGVLVEGVRADSIAVDWLGRNVYWIDGVISQIVAVRLIPTTAKMRDLTVILDEDLDQPRSLALAPEAGLMFWSEIGNAVKIERAGMDGSERKALVTSSLGWPGGIAVDPISERIFWTDERFKAIGSATFDGEDILILQMRSTKNPFALVVLDDTLYWSDTKRRVVQAAHKITGKNHRVLLKRPRQPFGVKIIHPIIQQGSVSPCEMMSCSHMCVLAPGLKGICKCPAGLLLAEDGLTCSTPVDSAFLLMLSPSTVTQIYLQTWHQTSVLKGWPEHIALQIPNVNEAAILDYRMQDHTLFLTDAGTTGLSSFKLNDLELTFHGHILKLLGDGISAMAVDWVTLNIYWSSNKQNRLQVTDGTHAYMAVLIKEELTKVDSIALHPPSGRLCFNNLGLTGLGSEATVECANMDGSERKVVWKDAVQPTSLIFSDEGDSIYWADTNLEVICSVQLDGSRFKELKVGKGLSAVALSGDRLIWITVDEKTQLWYVDEQQQNRLWFEVGSEVTGLKAFSKSSQSGTNRCEKNNGDCQHLCLAVPGGRTCKCAHEFVLQNDTHCAPEQHCPAGKRSCLDEHTCLLMEQFCNGHVDCPDHSDENCVNTRPSSEAAFPFTTKSLGSTTSPPLSEGPELDTGHDDGRMFLNLDAQTCSESRCSGQGLCEEDGNGDLTCTCSFGYSGDSCQDGFLETLQLPLVYGSAGLCGAVVLIILLVVVVVRKRGSSTRRVGPGIKETSMTNLENTAENAGMPTSENVQRMEVKEPRSSVH